MQTALQGRMGVPHAPSGDAVCVADLSRFRHLRLHSMKPATSLYRCKHCGKVVEREGTKQWRKSFCEQTGKNARIMLVKTVENNP
jgi:hypothetical protein